MTSDLNFALWPILPYGADENNNGGNSGAGAGEGSNQQQQNNQGGQGNSSQNNQGGESGTGSSKTTDDDDDDPYEGMSAKELKKLLSDAEKDKTTTATELQQIKDAQDAEKRKKNDENTNLKADLEASQAREATLRAALTQQSIINAIRDDSRYEWHNASIVAQQLDPQIVKVDDNGKVTGLPKELSRIAKEESLKMLLKKDNTQQNQNGANNQQQQNNSQQHGSTGFQPGQGGANSGGGQAPNANELADKIPALRSHM